MQKRRTVLLPLAFSLFTHSRGSDGRTVGILMESKQQRQKKKRYFDVRRRWKVFSTSKNILNVTRTLFCLLKASPEHYFVVRAPFYCTFHVSCFFLDVPGTLPADTPYGSIFLSRCAGARKRHETSGHIFHHILYYRIRIFITKRSRAWIHNAGMRGDV